MKTAVYPGSFDPVTLGHYWQTMFAFQRWSSALEMKRYLCRYVHHIDGLPDFLSLIHILRRLMPF